ncbi:hypothetical protein [Altererythrobacter aquiaggeris]|uniref:Nmad3 family putative nucleotide modification protein n=1 Tax=Aestuarierythrobacter aquiaggeris TaxID=1898396 RepID=UPI00301A950A
MKIIFSRKGFDSAAGGGPSPIVGCRPVSLPIPSCGHSRTTYGDLELGDHAAKASRGKLGAADFCHHDPMFLADRTCLFGQCSAAQTHLENQQVGRGDVFVFFGLFREEQRGKEQEGEPHHRIFAFMEIAEIVRLEGCCGERKAELEVIGHPHALGMHAKNDVIYAGAGQTAQRASPALRLTVPGGPPSLWNRPAWLTQGGLSYHGRADRWLPGYRLRSVARGQEFVADIGRRKAPRKWLDTIISEIKAT